MLLTSRKRVRARTHIGALGLSQTLSARSRRAKALGRALSVENLPALFEFSLASGKSPTGATSGPKCAPIPRNAENLRETLWAGLDKLEGKEPSDMIAHDSLSLPARKLKRQNKLEIFSRCLGWASLGCSFSLPACLDRGKGPRLFSYESRRLVCRRSAKLGGALGTQDGNDPPLDGTADTGDAGIRDASFKLQGRISRATSSRTTTNTLGGGREDYGV